MEKLIKLEGGSTRKSRKTWDDYKIDFLDPSYILITRNREDAIERGYYQPSEYEYSDGTNSVDAPTFIIKNQWGKELWLDGCNCGYGGQGPRGSERILKDIGLPAQIIDQVFYRHIFELERNEEGTYEFIGDGRSQYTDTDILSTSHIIIKDGDLIIQHDANYPDIEETIEFTKFYVSRYLGSVKECLIFSNYEDVKGEGYTGFTKRKPLNRAPYKFILIGENDREIWLNPIFEGKTELVDEPKVRTIMEALGYDLGSPLHPKIEWIKKNILSIKPINTAIRFDNE